METLVTHKAHFLCEGDTFSFGICLKKTLFVYKKKGFYL